MLDPTKHDAARRRGADEAALIDRFEALDARRKQLQHDLDGLRSERNTASKAMAKLDKAGDEFAKTRDSLKELSTRVKAGEKELAEIDGEAHELAMVIPNAPHESVADGAGEADNTEISVWGDKPSFDFTPKPHWEIGEALGILDFEAAAKISGARFCVLRDGAAKLTRALMNFMVELHVSSGYREVWPPVMLRRHAMEGTGQLPKFEDDAFKTASDDPAGEYFLSPTAEVAVTNLHRDEILTADDLPLHYVAYAPCFRAEAGSYGKDTRGLIRQHQFDKVELVKLCTPETSYDEHEAMRADAERVLQTLGLHYRVVSLCTGDLGFAAAKTYDLEVWLPGQDAYREISSVSNCEDFQARRAKIRYRPAQGEKPRRVHTLNGSGLAIGRTIVAVLEQCQRADGSVAIPEALRPLMGGQESISPPA